MIRAKPLLWISAGLLLIFSTAVFQLKALASCEEDCEVPRSCKEYLECRTSQMECLAACKQKEAWELSARSSEKSIAATERMAQILEQTFRMSERITLLLDKLITKMAQEKASGEKTPEEPQEIQSTLAPLPAP
jgi:hypothetical protein